MGLRLKGVWLVGLQLVAGCASGDGTQVMAAGATGRTANPNAAPQEMLTATPVVEPVAGTAGAATPMMTVEFDGESCRPGAVVVCDCPNGTSGAKHCEDNPASPSGGSYGECMNCDGAEMSEGSNPNAPPCANGVRDGEESDVDCGGLCTPCELGRACLRGIDCDTLNCSNGTCAESEAPPPVMSTAPDPSEAGGLIGGGGSGCGGACTNDCFPVGVLPCCAGTRCGCTWAPGAYCL